MARQNTVLMFIAAEAHRLIRELDYMLQWIVDLKETIIVFQRIIYRLNPFYIFKIVHFFIGKAMPFSQFSLHKNNLAW